MPEFIGNTGSKLLDWAFWKLAQTGMPSAAADNYNKRVPDSLGPPNENSPINSWTLRKLASILGPNMPLTHPEGVNRREWENMEGALNPMRLHPLHFTGLFGPGPDSGDREARRLEALASINTSPFSPRADISQSAFSPSTLTSLMNLFPPTGEYSPTGALIALLTTSPNSGSVPQNRLDPNRFFPATKAEFPIDPYNSGFRNPQPPPGTPIPRRNVPPPIPTSGPINNNGGRTDFFWPTPTPWAR